MSIKSAKAKARGHFHIEGSVLKGTLKSACTGFDVELAVESDEDPAKLAKMIEVAHNSCYAESTLENPVPINRTHMLNGAPFDPDEHNQD